MFVVSVIFTIKSGSMADFLPLMRDQARNSLEREPACSRFDVCTDPDDPDAIFLYEVYDDEAAFRLHLQSAHFQAFDAAVAGLVAAKQVRIWQRIA